MLNWDPWAMKALLSSNLNAKQTKLKSLLNISEYNRCKLVITMCQYCSYAECGPLVMEQSKGLVTPANGFVTEEKRIKHAEFGYPVTKFISSDV